MRIVLRKAPQNILFMEKCLVDDMESVAPLEEGQILIGRHVTGIRIGQRTVSYTHLLYKFTSNF